MVLEPQRDPVRSSASPAARRAELASGYLFECACARCVREAPHEARLHALTRRLADARAATIAAIDEQRWGDALTSSGVCCKLCDDLLQPADSLGATDGGATTSRLASLPSVGIERLRHAKLLSNASRLGEAAAEWARALATLRCTHGEGSMLVRAIGDDLAWAESELRRLPEGEPRAVFAS